MQMLGERRNSWILNPGEWVCVKPKVRFAIRPNVLSATRFAAVRQVLALMFCRIDPQHLHQICDFCHVPQRLTGWLVIPAQEIRKEDILERVTAPRARFDFA